jgi:hypothetical protein
VYLNSEGFNKVRTRPKSTLWCFDSILQ